MSSQTLNVLLLVIAGSVAVRGATDSSSSDGLTALLPAVSDDSQAAREVRIHFQGHEFADVARRGEDLIRSSPQSWEGYFWRGAAAIQERQFYDAVRNLRAAEKLHPPHNMVAKNLAIAYYLLDQGKLFELKMKEALVEDPSDFAPPYYLGRYYLSSTEFDVSVAVQAFAKALEKKPDDVASICFYAIALETMGEFGRARERFLRATRLSGGNGMISSLAYQGLSRLTLAEEPGSALDFARHAAAAEPKSVQAQLQLAKAAAAAGERNEQLVALHTAAGLAANDARPQYQLMQVYRQMGDAEEARVAAAGYQQRVSCFGNEAGGIR